MKECVVVSHIPLKANVDQATRDCDCVDAIVVVERTGGKVIWNERDIWYHDLMKNASHRLSL